VQDAGEAALPGWQVFVDLHGDDIFHYDDPSAITNNAGQYTITGLTPGQVTISEIVPPGWAQSSPDSFATKITVSAGITAIQNFGDVFGAGVSKPISYSVLSIPLTASASVLQPDNKLVIVGTDGTNTPYLARFFPNGAPDNTFGPSGNGEVNLSADFSKITGIVVEPDGTIVAVGNSPLTFLYMGGGSIEALNPDGTFDTAFQASNSAFRPHIVSDEVFDGFINIQIRPSGHLLLTGFASQYVTVLLYDLNPIGTPDPTFGTHVTNLPGLGIYPLESALGIIRTSISPNNSIYVTADSAVLALTSSGGYVYSTNNGFYFIPGSILNEAVDVNNNLYVVFSQRINDPYSDLQGVFISRLQGATLDTTFGTAGTVSVNDGYNPIASVSLLNDGTILTLGSYYTGPYLANGNPEIDTYPLFGFTGYYHADGLLNAVYGGYSASLLSAGAVSVTPVKKYGPSSFTKPINAGPTTPGEDTGTGEQSLATSNAAPVATLVQSSSFSNPNDPFYFYVSYTDASAIIDQFSISNANIQVIRQEDGVNLQIQYEGEDSSSTSQDVIARYAIVPPNGDWSSADNGSYTVSMAGNQVTDDTLYVAGGPPPLGNVTALLPPPIGPAAQLAFSQQPTNAIAGQAISPGITVTVEDSGENVVATDNSSVTLSIASGPAGATPGGTLTANAINGMATFSNVILDAAGSYTLMAADTGLTAATSAAFNVGAASVVHLAFVQNPTNVPVGANISPAISVKATDAFGNSVMGDTVGLSINSGPTGGTISGAASAITDANGIAMFSAISFPLGGTYTLSAADGTVSAQSSSFNSNASLSQPIVQASGGAFPHHVQLTWTAVSGAASYQVFRSTTNDLNTAVKIGAGITTTAFNDNSTLPGALYYYWIRARNPSAIGPFSASVGGYTPLPAPTGVAGTTTLPHHVAIIWNAVTGAAGYQVFRSSTNDFSTALKIAGGITATFFNDTTALQGQVYFYWVRPRNSVGLGLMSISVMGSLG
jgi:uncharacterized delta-60 repeat protein